MATLERAIQIMVEVHSGQVDKGGNPTSWIRCVSCSRGTSTTSAWLVRSMT